MGVQLMNMLKIVCLLGQCVYFDMKTTRLVKGWEKWGHNRVGSANLEILIPLPHCYISAIQKCKHCPH